MLNCQTQFVCLLLCCQIGFSQAENTPPLKTETNGSKDKTPMLSIPSSALDVSSNHQVLEPLVTPLEERKDISSKSQKSSVEQGWASWYGKKFHGKRTASGKKFNMYDFSVAHPQLPFFSWVKVTLVETGQSVIAQVTDRGPYTKDRIVDLSKAAAQSIGLLGKGVAKVEVEPIDTSIDSIAKSE